MVPRREHDAICISVSSWGLVGYKLEDCLLTSWCRSQSCGPCCALLWNHWRIGMHEFGDICETSVFVNNRDKDNASLKRISSGPGSDTFSTKSGTVEASHLCPLARRTPATAARVRSLDMNLIRLVKGSTAKRSGHKPATAIRVSLWD